MSSWRKYVLRRYLTLSEWRVEGTSTAVDKESLSQANNWMVGHRRRRTVKDGSLSWRNSWAKDHRRRRATGWWFNVIEGPVSGRSFIGGGSSGRSSCVDDEWSRRRPHRLRASGRISSSTTDDQEDFYTEGVRWDLLRRQRNSGWIIHANTDEQDVIYTDSVRRLLHRQRSGAGVFYIHRYQVLDVLVISNSPRCNLGLF